MNSARKISEHSDSELDPAVAMARPIADLYSPALLTTAGRVSKTVSRPMDRILRTREIEQVTGRHRSTIFRWTKAGQFPRKHKSGGWLRSEVEHWLKGEPPCDEDAVHASIRSSDSPR